MIYTYAYPHTHATHMHERHKNVRIKCSASGHIKQRKPCSFFPGSAQKYIKQIYNKNVICLLMDRWMMMPTGDMQETWRPADLLRIATHTNDTILPIFGCDTANTRVHINASNIVLYYNAERGPHINMHEAAHGRPYRDTRWRCSSLLIELFPQANLLGHFKIEQPNKAASIRCLSNV